MTITLNADYDVTLNTALLGYVGETNARPVSVEGLTVDGADRYVLTIDYGDGTAYEVDITDGTWTPTADILRSAQTVSLRSLTVRLLVQARKRSWSRERICLTILTKPIMERM